MQSVDSSGIHGATLATLNDVVGQGKNKHITFMVHNELAAIPELCGSGEPVWTHVEAKTGLAELWL